MGFWDNVLAELDYLGMSNRTLAKQAGFDPSNIGRGIRLKSSPSADTAVKIANVLNVSVEYLVTGEKKSSKKNFDERNVFRKYAPTLEKLESIPEKSRASILRLIDSVSDDCR